MSNHRNGSATRPPLALLAIGSFAVGIPTFVLAGLVPLLARDLDISEGTAGQTTTVIALSYAVLSPVLATATTRFPRKRVLLAALALFVVGGTGAALAPGFPTLLVALVLTGGGAALYTPTASATASALSPPERRGRALAVVLGGIAVAIAVGAPIGTVVGGAAGWRAAFWLTAAVGAVALVVMAVLLGDIGFAAPSRLRDRIAPLADRGVLAVLGAQLLMFVGSFSLYPYLGAAMAPVTGGDSGRLAVIIWMWGLAAVVGTAFAGRLTDIWGPRRMIMTGIVGMLLLTALVPWIATTMVTATIWAALWSISGWMTVPGQQHRMVSAAPASAPVTLGLLAATQYLGIALGGVIGGLVLDVHGSRGPGFGAAGIGLAALVFTVATYRPGRGGGTHQTVETSASRPDREAGLAGRG